MTAEERHLRDPRRGLLSESSEPKKNPGLVVHGLVGREEEGPARKVRFGEGSCEACLGGARRWTMENGGQRRNQQTPRR